MIKGRLVGSKELSTHTLSWIREGPAIVAQCNPFLILVGSKQEQPIFFYSAHKSYGFFKWPQILSFPISIALPHKLVDPSISRWNIFLYPLNLN